MDRFTAKYPKQTTMAEFSAKLVRYYRLPHGSRIALRRKGASAKNTRTLVRSDIKIRRKVLRNADHPDRDENPKASEVFARIKRMLPPDIGRKFDVIGLGPDGSRVDGHRSLNRWRQMTPVPTQQQLENAAMRHEEIATLVKTLRMVVNDLEEGIDDPEQKVPQAVIQALLDRFGNSSVRDALTEMRLAG